MNIRAGDLLILPWAAITAKDQSVPLAGSAETGPPLGASIKRLRCMFSRIDQTHHLSAEQTDHDCQPATSAVTGDI